MQVRSVLVGATALTAVLGLGVLSQHQGDAAPVARGDAPNCGGQSANNFVGPDGFVCKQQGVVSGVGYRLDVTVRPDLTYTLTFSLSRAISTIVGLQANAHPHLSSDPGTLATFTTLEAGQTSVTWSGSFPAGSLCDPHQFDVKAQPGVPGSADRWDAKYRISGATFVFALVCTAPTTTAAPTTIPGTTVPGATTPATVLPAQVNTVAPGAIPATR